MAQEQQVVKERIHGFTVYFDRGLIRTAVEYLRRDLQYNEAKTLFDAARFDGTAYFEDDEDRDFSLIYNRGVYTLIKRDME